jgi:hypothetical protein
MPTSILELPYADRQLIVVADDAVIDAERKASNDAAAERKTKSWVDLAQPLLVRSVSGVVVDLAVETVKAWQRLRETGVRVLSVSRTEAKTLRFPPGHPRDSVLYVGHPTSPETYFTTAQFHRLTFEHKFVEAVSLLMSLGAVEMSVEHVVGWSRDFSAKLSIPVLASAGEMAATAGANDKQSSQMLFTAALNNEATPAVPLDLVWYPHEPTWQAIADGRLKYGLTDFALTVRYEDDFGVNAGLKVAASKVGLDLGGRFEDHVSTVWRIAGKFAKPGT